MKKVRFFIICPILLICLSCAELNNLLHNVNTTTKTLQGTANGLKGLSNSVKGLTNTLKLTKTEFDKTVKVFKEGDPSIKRTSVPKNKLTKLEIKKGRAQNLEWEPVAHFDNQLFPSVIVSMATYKEPVVGSLANSIKSDALGFMFISNKSYLPLKYEIECVDKKYFSKINGEFIYHQAGQKEIFMPEIPWNFEALTKQSTNTPLKIYYRIFDEDGKMAEKLLTVTMRSIDDCIFSYNGFNMDFMFAAYVQEQHPEIDNILRDALNTKLVNRWVGYQLGEDEVDRQIMAIWRVLHDRGFVYSSIADNAGDKGLVVSQAVRTFDTSLKTNQANCVDGSIVFASILKRIGLYPILVMVPGHCFLGYLSTNDPKTVKFKFLETVMLGESGNLSKMKTSLTKNKEYEKLFKNAQNEGLRKYLKHKKEDYANLISIKNERNRVAPIPYYP